MQSWWGEIAQARSRIEALAKILGPFDSFNALQSSETPAKDLLHDSFVGQLIVSRLSTPSAGGGNDELCQWLFETFLLPDLDLQNVVLRFVPAICAAYLPRSSSKPGQPLAGFEAVLLALYSSEYKSRQGKPLVVNIPTLSQPSLYHAPRSSSPSPSELQSTKGYLSPALEPQETVKTTKRAAIIGVALELYHRRIASMPGLSKLEICQAARIWAMRGCSWAEKVDEIAKLALLETVAPGPDPTLTGEVANLGPSSSTSIFVPGSGDRDEDEDDEEGRSGGRSTVLRIPMPWELLQPILRILGHCLMGPSNSQEIRNAARAAAQAFYARATHELIPEAILPTRALLRLDEAVRAQALAAELDAAAAASVVPSKPKKPEVLLTQP